MPIPRGSQRGAAGFRRRRQLLLTRFEISDSLRSEIIARAKRLVTAPDDGTMYWHDYLGVAGLCAGGERHAAVQRAVDAALKWDNLDSVVFAIAKLSPEGQFQMHGGWKRLNTVFDGKLEQLLGDLQEAVWQDAG